MCNSSCWVQRTDPATGPAPRQWLPELRRRCGDNPCVSRGLVQPCVRRVRATAVMPQRVAGEPASFSYWSCRGAGNGAVTRPNGAHGPFYAYFGCPVAEPVAGPREYRQTSRPLRLFDRRQNRRLTGPRDTLVVVTEEEPEDLKLAYCLYGLQQATLRFDQAHWHRNEDAFVSVAEAVSWAVALDAVLEDATHAGRDGRE